MFVNYIFTNPYLATLQLGHPAAGLPDYGFVYIFVKNKQMAFSQIFVSQQLLFLFSKHLDTTLNVTDYGTSRIYLWQKLGGMATKKFFFFKVVRRVGLIQNSIVVGLGNMHNYIN